MVGTILVIGDQNKQGVELKDALKKETNFAVSLIPKNGISVNVIIEKSPDLIVFNPKASYFEAIDLYYSIKKETQTQETPMALLMDETEMKTADLPSGILEVFYRPLRVSETVARINHLFKRL